jgi:hypothetical protein
MELLDLVELFSAFAASGKMLLEFLCLPLRKLTVQLEWEHALIVSVPCHTLPLV